MMSIHVIIRSCFELGSVTTNLACKKSPVPMSRKMKLIHHIYK